MAYTHAYHADKLQRAATGAGENLDGFLSKTILRGLSAKPVKTPLLFFYAPHSEFTFISLSSRNLKARCDWLYGMEAHYEAGREAVRDNARPFLYWDGQKLHRIYEMPEDLREEAKYISDFGALWGLLVGEADDYDYRRIKENPTENWDYSAVPLQHEEFVSLKATSKAPPNPGGQQVLFSDYGEVDTEKSATLLLLHNFYR